MDSLLLERILKQNREETITEFDKSWNDFLAMKSPESY
jgi:hypothetical protein